jgi:hypothetical protein
MVFLNKSVEPEGCESMKPSMKFQKHLSWTNAETYELLMRSREVSFYSGEEGNFPCFWLYDKTQQQHSNSAKLNFPQSSA